MVRVGEYRWWIYIKTEWHNMKLFSLFTMLFLCNWFNYQTIVCFQCNVINWAIVTKFIKIYCFNKLNTQSFHKFCLRFMSLLFWETPFTSMQMELWCCIWPNIFDFIILYYINPKLKTTTTTCGNISMM